MWQLIDIKATRYGAPNKDHIMNKPLTFGYFNTLSLELTGPQRVSDTSLAGYVERLRPSLVRWMFTQVSRCWI